MEQWNARLYIVSLKKSAVNTYMFKEINMINF